MRITIEYPAYNEKRYNKPWIAKVASWPVGSRPVFVFGGFVGAPGAAGYVEIDAAPGDIIATGQKDYRGNNTERDFYIVQDDGSLSSEPVDMRTARDAFIRHTNRTIQ